MCLSCIILQPNIYSFVPNPNPNCNVSAIVTDHLWWHTTAIIHMTSNNLIWHIDDDIRWQVRGSPKLPNIYPEGNMTISTNFHSNPCNRYFSVSLMVALDVKSGEVISIHLVHGFSTYSSLGWFCQWSFQFLIDAVHLYSCSSIRL